MADEAKTKEVARAKRKEERKKRAALRRKKLQQRLENENIKILEDSITSSNDSVVLNWKYATNYDECQLCQDKVSSGFMDDHLNTICPENEIKCNLCQISIKRKELKQHWNDGILCNEYKLVCSRSVRYKDDEKGDDENSVNNKCIFDDILQFIEHQHNVSYPEYKQETKLKWYFNIDNNDKYKEILCRNDAKERIIICNECGQRCEIENGEIDRHECDFAPWVTMAMHLGWRRKEIGRDLVANFVRKNVEQYIPSEIKLLIAQYIYQ